MHMEGDKIEFGSRTTMRAQCAPVNRITLEGLFRFKDHNFTSPTCTLTITTAVQTMDCSRCSRHRRCTYVLLRMHA